MKVFITSDLHYTAYSQELVEKVAHFTKGQSTAADILLLLGDYGNNITEIRRCLEHFVDFPGKKLVVFGNHDLWEQDSPNTEKRLELLIQESYRMGMFPLDDQAYASGVIGFVGGVGWYDYSFRHVRDGFPMRAYENKVLPGTDEPIWNDYHYCDWGATDLEVTNRSLEKFKANLDILSGVPRVIVGIHHVPTRYLLYPVRSLVPVHWRFCNSFLGSTKYQRLFSLYPNVEAVFCGHIHNKKTVHVKGVPYTSNGSAKKKRFLVVYDAEKKNIQNHVFGF